MDPGTSKPRYKVVERTSNRGPRYYSIYWGSRLIALIKNHKIAMSYLDIPTVTTSVDGDGKPRE